MAENYGAPGPDALLNQTLYTGSGPLWRTRIVNWEDMPVNNSAENPKPQPSPDPCAKPQSFADNIICLY